MSEVAFPVDDLLRRRLQTGLTVLSLAVCVASTLFLLLLTGQIGIGISATATNMLTAGTASVFAQFLTFVGFFIFVVGAVITSFIVFLMMSQRTKDYGLMKATGCPNSLVFGYFLTELLELTFVGCVLGVVFGWATDYIVVNFAISNVYNQAPNLWFIPVVFAAFFMFALIFGAKPILDAARISPAKALSQVHYFGFAKEKALKPLTRTGLTFRIALRSLFRRKTGTIRIVIFLSVVFLLLTVAIAGSIIADDTSSLWVEKATGRNTILISENLMTEQYIKLLQKFSGDTEKVAFNYSDPQLAISDSVIQLLNQTQGIAKVSARIVWMGTIVEQQGYTIDPETYATITLGDHRAGTSLIVGLDENFVNEPITYGQFLDSNSNFEAVIGDSIAQRMFSSEVFSSAGVRQVINADPLRQSVTIENVTFKITGTCLDPLNAGHVTYIPIDKLRTITGISNPNLLIIQVDSSADFQKTISQVKKTLNAQDPKLTIIDINEPLQKNLSFLHSLWRIVALLPTFALTAAALCLISYLALTIDEQHQELGILRATGAKPATIVEIIAIQCLTILFASLGVGASLGTIVCILTLTSNPAVSVFTVVEISGWLLSALLGMFLLSLIPAIRFSKKSLPNMMS